jgi:hypothetical protein
MNVPLIVQRSCRPRAANAALMLFLGQHNTSDLRLERCRSRDQNRGQQDRLKTEGKIKGSARCRPLSQSARGLGAARRLAASVPFRGESSQGTRGEGAPHRKWFVALNWMCHGLA